MRTNPVELNLKSALVSTGMVVPVKSSYERGRVSVLCRQVPGREKAWLKVIHLLLQVAEDSGVELHACRRYVLKNGQLVFGWHLGLEAPARQLSRVVDGLLETLADVEPDLEPAEAPPRAARPRPAASVDEDGSEEGQGRDEAATASPVRAAPRPAAGGSLPQVSVPPQDFTPRLRVTRNTVDAETGARIIEEEMPLPHVYQELNKPTHPGGRGAKLMGATAPARRG